MRDGSIRFDRVSKKYGNKYAAEDVSFRVEEGEFFGIVGPSGSGKSTTLMMLAGFVVPSSGIVEIGGTVMNDLPPQKRQLGMMFQSYAVFPHLTVGENIAFPLEVRRRPRDEVRREVERVLELVRLPGYQSRAPQSLSGGELQRVALARAIVFRPKVLLMDEPLSALDKELRNYMQLELKRIQAELGVTVLYVTHDQGEALSMSDKLAVMNRGRIEQLGTPSALYEKPESRFVAGFLGESNLISATVTAAGGEFAQATTTDGQVISGRAAGPLRVGQPVTAAIRPEKLHVGAAAAATDQNRFIGRVAASNYGGEFIRYSLRTDRSELIIKVPNGSETAGWTMGREVTVTWSADDTTLFGEEA